jgi:hypothetical protein
MALFGLQIAPLEVEERIESNSVFEALSHRSAAHFGKVIEKHRDHLDLMAVRIDYRMIQTRADHG